jgi:hypothetical protein
MLILLRPEAEETHATQDGLLLRERLDAKKARGTECERFVIFVSIWSPIVSSPHYRNCSMVATSH